MRLWMLMILRCKPGQFVLLAGTLCSSWVAINAGTHGRSFNDPMGKKSMPSVLYGNRMVSRIDVVQYMVCVFT